VLFRSEENIKNFKKNAILLHYQKVEDYRLDLLDDDMDLNKENNPNGGSKTNKIKSRRRINPSIKKYRKHNRNNSIKLNKRKYVMRN
jgi:hypothetical protein